MALLLDHQPVFLYLYDPNDEEVGSSISETSVFQKVRFTETIGSGFWRLRAKGSAGQTVYWAAQEGETNFMFLNCYLRFLY
jgi:hypothetical protein